MDQRRRTSRHKRPGPNTRRQGRDTQGAKWRPVEIRVRGNVAVEVSELPLQVPRYSFRTGTAHFDDVANDFSVKPYLTQANGIEGAELLLEVVKVYEAKRSARFAEIQERRSNWQGGDGNVEAV